MGSLVAIISEGNIKFIPKLEDSKLISSWRTITLPNVSYNRIAKALALRLRPLLPQIVRLEQIGFI